MVYSISRFFVPNLNFSSSTLNVFPIVISPKVLWNGIYIVIYITYVLNAMLKGIQSCISKWSLKILFKPKCPWNSVMLIIRRNKPEISYSINVKHWAYVPAPVCRRSSFGDTTSLYYFTALLQLAYFCEILVQPTRISMRGNWSMSKFDLTFLSWGKKWHFWMSD